MALKEDLQLEIDRLDLAIKSIKLQQNHKLDSLLKVAKRHSKLLKNYLDMVKRLKLTPNIALLNFDECAELHLESARTFIDSVIGGT